MPSKCQTVARQAEKTEFLSGVFFWVASKGKGSTREGRVRAHMDVTERQRAEEQNKDPLRGTDRKTEIY